MAVGGMIKAVVGFPKIDLNTMCEIVSSQHAKTSFESGIDQGIQGLDELVLNFYFGGINLPPLFFWNS